jgi:hypothetical protein
VVSDGDADVGEGDGAGDEADGLGYGCGCRRGCRTGRGTGPLPGCADQVIWTSWDAEAAESKVRVALPAGVQAVVGIIAATAHRRLVGVGRRNGPVLAARGPRERVEPRAGGTRRRREQGVAQGGLCGLAAPEHAPAVKEEPVTVGLEQFSRCDPGVIHGQEGRARQLLSATYSSQRVFKAILFP